MKTVPLFFHLLVITLLWCDVLSLNVSNENTTTELNFTSRSISPRDLSGSFSSSISRSYAAYIDWSASQNPSALTSTITATFYIKKTAVNNYRTYNLESPPYSITIDGATFSGTQNFDFPASCAVGTTQTIGTASHTVSHNPDGSRSVGISAVLYSDISFGTFSVGGTANLNTINVYVTVYFNGNGGSASAYSMTARYGSAYGSLATASRSDYNFIGWYTAPSGGSPVSAGTPVISLYAHTLYAQWVAIQYTITFVANGGSACGSITGVCDSPFTLPSSSRTGYTFNYWCSDPWLTARYTGSTMPRYSFTLYAKWTANQYTAYYDGNGGTASTASKTVTYDSAYGILATAIKTGYDFNGWYTAPSGGSLVTVSTPMTTASDHTIYAQWTISSFTITFKSDGNVISSSKINYMGTITYPGNPSKTGHTFNGWDSSITSVPAHDVTINAKWIANKYFITVEDENGNMLDSGMFVFETELSFPSINKAGYTTIFTTDEGDVLTTVPDYDAIIRVSYAIRSYIMSFAYENGTVIDSHTQEYNSTVDFPTVKKEGYTFVGWRTNENVMNTTTVPASDMSFYPVFTPNTYKTIIMYDGNRSIVKEFKYGDVINLTSLGNEVLNEYEVLGWYTDPELINKIESNNITVPAYNIELYPHVISNRVEIVIEGNKLKKKDVKNIIKKYTDAEFVIEEIKTDKGKTIVIIRFNDPNDANKFIGVVEGSFLGSSDDSFEGSSDDSPESGNNIIKIGFKYDKYDSFTSAIHAFALCVYLFLSFMI